MSNLSIRQIVLGTLVVTAVALVFWFFFRFHNLLLMLFAAIIISSATQPGVRWLGQRGITRHASIILVYGLLILIVGLVIWLGLPLIIDQTATLTETLTDIYQIVRQTITSSGNLIARRLASALPLELSLNAAAPSDGEDVMASLTQLSDMLIAGFRSMLGVLTTFLLAFYWTLESERIKRGLLLLFPQDRRVIVRDLIENSEEKISSYVIGQGILVLAVGALALVAYLIIGLPHAITLAIIAGIMEAVPLLGPVLGAIPAALIAISISPTHLVWVIVSTTIIQQLENTLLVPRIMDRAVGVRPLVTLLAMYAFGSLFGVPGVLISIPLAAIIQLLLDRFVLKRTDAPEENGRDKNSVIRYQVQDLVQDIREQIRNKSRVPSADTDEIEDSLEALALDLDSFLAQAKIDKQEQA